MQRQHVRTGQECPICATQAANGYTATTTNVQKPQVECPCCGRFELDRTAAEVLSHQDLSEAKWTAIAYQLRRMTDRSEVPCLTNYGLESLIDSAVLPGPVAFLDDLVLWIGTHVEHAGSTVSVNYPAFKAILGAVNHEDFNYKIHWIDRDSDFTGKTQTFSNGPNRIDKCALTPQGWERFRVLNDATTRSMVAFMAMKYNDPELEIVVRDYFTPAVAAAGFKLRRLDDNQPAGLIDDQLRVAIRTSRILICDLTHGNRGAYWEAGFAEGLGIPVIYTCRSNVFSDRAHENHPHFDTSHLVTIAWDPASLATAADKLKATIRATLPAEARLQD